MSFGITNKEASYKLYERGEFGNKLRIWSTVDSLLMDSYSGTVTIRYSSKYGKWCAYEVEQGGIKTELAKWKNEGADLTLVRFNESAPDENLVMQGEFVADSDYKYILSYSTDKVKMREAMRLPRELLGVKALHFMQSHLSLESNRNLKRLLNTYPCAVVEFSVYNHFIGDTPANNTVFWEVRNY